MNEGKKTGIFWAVAVVMLAIATLVAWPAASNNENNVAGQLLFEKFTDPLAAARTGPVADLGPDDAAVL